MEAIHFIWNKEKAIANQQKHGISFDEARTVFYDENARLRHDPDHSMDEDRFLLLGISQLLRILVVCHCYREDDLQIRIISARKATKAERKQYELFRS
jgi:uncharacterized DUF497 family protein